MMRMPAQAVLCGDMQYQDLLAVSMPPQLSQACVSTCNRMLGWKLTWQLQSRALDVMRICAVDVVT